ncbi:MAG TPA: hypothetical protein VGD50_03150 [Candidatus Baltobacteraceae bacterium]
MDALLDFRSSFEDFRGAVDARFTRIESTQAEHSAVLHEYAVILREHSTVFVTHSMALNRIERRQGNHSERLRILESRLGPSSV